MAGRGPPGGGNTVLVVEREALVRFDTVSFFADRGWEVLEAENAAHAMALLERRTEIRVVLVDVPEPGDTEGLTLAHYVRRRFPPTLLFVTSVHAPIAAEAMPARATFVPKPFDLYRVFAQIEDAPRQVGP